MVKPIFSVDVSGPKESRYASLTLPATDYELLDVLDKLGIQDDKAMSWEIAEYHCFGSLAPFLEGNGSLCDLNHLARGLAQMNMERSVAFEGLLQMEIQKEEVLGLPALIDLAHNANQGVCYVSPALSDQDLGEFYVDNDLLPELADLPDHVVKLLDYSKIGKEQREAECGVFVPQRRDSPGGYVTQHTEMESIYDSLPHTPQKPASAILLLLGHNEFQTRLELPAAPQTLDTALDAIAAGGWDDEVHIRCLDCAAPALIPAIGDDDNIAHINRLAQKLAEMEPQQLTKFKAVLDATEDFSVLGATHIAYTLSDYLFTPQYASPEDMAQDFLASSLGTPAMMTLSRYVNLYGYGEKLMEEQQCVLTGYGMVSREDGQCLKTSLSPSSPVQGGTAKWRRGWKGAWRAVVSDWFWYLQDGKSAGDNAKEQLKEIDRKCIEAKGAGFSLQVPCNSFYIYQKPVFGLFDIFVGFAPEKTSYRDFQRELNAYMEACRELPAGIAATVSYKDSGHICDHFRGREYVRSLRRTIYADFTVSSAYSAGIMAQARAKREAEIARATGFKNHLLANRRELLEDIAKKVRDEFYVKEWGVYDRWNSDGSSPIAIFKDLGLQPLVSDDQKRGLALALIECLSAAGKTCEYYNRSERRQYFDSSKMKSCYKEIGYIEVRIIPLPEPELQAW